MGSRIIVVGALLLASPVLWTACGRVPRKARAKAEALAPLAGIDLPPDPGAWDAWRNSLAPAGKPGPRLTLARDGRTDYRIVVPENASSQDRTAARELEHYLKEMTGAAFQVVSEARLTGKSRKLISVGRTDLLKQSAIPALEDDLAEEGYGIAVKRGTLFLWGGARRGAINAVFALLEEDLGCRWYSNDDSRIPHCPTLRFAPVPRTYKPPLRLRDPFYKVSFDPAWSLRNRTNAPLAEVDEAAGGRIDYAEEAGFVHTFHNLMPPAKYFKEHPGYYMLDGGGNRVAHQLCTTNPDVLRIVTERVREILAKSPNADIVSVSKMDGGGTCQCEKCKALDDAEGAQMASLLYLVNRVAENIEKDYPNIVISTLAYLETIGVPKTVRPRRNVAIRVCTDSCSWSAPFTPARQSERFAPTLKEWSKVCKRMYIWDYVVNFSHYTAPMPNMEVIADNIRFFVENNAEGIMTQGAYQSPGAERDWMRSWVIAKLMWDPSRDLWELMRDFAWGHYGKAGAAMAAYDRLLWQAGQDHKKELAAPAGGIRYLMDSPFLSKDFLDRACALLDRAQEMAENEAVFKRVEIARIPIMYVKLCRGPEFTGPDYPSILKRFESAARMAGLTTIAEGAPDIEQRIAAWRKVWDDALAKISPEIKE